MKWLRGLWLLLLLGACASPRPQHIAFVPPNRFVRLDTQAGRAATYVDRGAHEEIDIGTTTHAPPRHIPPGQHIAPLVVCQNVTATLWELTNGKAVELHFYEPITRGYFLITYTRRKGRPAARDVMYAITTACPQSP